MCFDDCFQSGYNYCTGCKSSFCNYHITNHKHAIIHLCYFGDCKNDASTYCKTCTNRFCSQHTVHKHKCQRCPRAADPNGLCGGCNYNNVNRRN
jgi:hypothetical protein